jgi:hypothetical protein
VIFPTGFVVSCGVMMRHGTWGSCRAEADAAGTSQHGGEAPDCGVSASGSGERGACSAGRRCKREPGIQVAARVSQQPIGGSRKVHNFVVAGCGSATSLEASIGLSAPICPEPAAPTGAIHIEFPGRATISVENGADGSLLRTILENLRQ